MTNEQMIRELRAVAEKYKGKHVFTCETNINLKICTALNCTVDEIMEIIPARED
jgi:DNA-binding Xre family transcriptional regulator